MSVCWLLMQISSTTKIIESNRTMVEELIKFLVIWFWFNDDGREEGCRLNEAKCQIEIKLKI